MRDFAALVDRIIEMEPGVAHCRDTVEKEVLHHQLLGAMRDAGLLRHLTFKGGTCLRLCHRAPRLAEDLDFSGGAFASAGMDHDGGGIVRKWVGRGGVAPSRGPKLGQADTSVG